MKSVLFIEVPPTIDWVSTSRTSKAGRRHPCLNETGEQTYSYQNLSSASVLRDKGYSVHYLHCPTQRLDLNATKNKIVEISPFMLVIMVEHITIHVSEAITQFAHDKNIFTVWVGPYPSALHATEIKKQFVDFILRKEWDFSIAELVFSLENNILLDTIKGLTWKRNDNEIVINPTAELIQNLDSLPIPAYDLINLTKFYESVFVSFPAATMITSRGCPNWCVFCSYPQTIYSRTFRAMSPLRVVREIKYLVGTFGVKEIRIDDDTYNIDPNRVIEICKLLIKEKIKVYYSIQVRPQLLTEEQAYWLKKSGCRMVLFGVESGNDDILKKMKKNTTTDEIRRGVRIAKKFGIDVLNSVMLGFYWDTKETVEQTIQFAFELNAEFTQMSTPTPLPGTEYAQLLEENNCFLTKDWAQHDSVHHAAVRLPHLSEDDLNAFLKTFYRRYYRRPRYLWMMFWRMFRSWDNFKQSLRKFTVLFTK